MASAVATASCVTLTFLQAVVTNPVVTKLRQRLGLLKSDVEPDINDIYGIMSEAITDFVEGKDIKGLVIDPKDMSTKPNSMRSMLQDTVDLLFTDGDNVNTREFSKDPTMTFVYGQSRDGSIKSMANSLADRIVNNLDDPKTLDYLAKLFNDNKYKNKESGVLKDTKGLYKDIINQLTAEDRNLPGLLWDIMDIRINNEFLENFKVRSDNVFEFVKKLENKNGFKILPASAVLAGIKPTKANLEKYGMPISKIFEVLNKVPDSEHTVLTREQKSTKTVADVSTIHGIDAAQLYHALNKVMSDMGIVVVHDEVRGTVQDVRAMENEYREVTKTVTSEYDIHQAIMKAVAAYSPEIASSEEFKALMGEIQATVDDKAKIIKEQFNDETSALIGDGDAYIDFAKGKKGLGAGLPANLTQQSGIADQDVKKTKKVPAFTKPDSEDFAVASNVLDELAGESETITKFMDMANKSKVEFGSENRFIPVDDTITITGTDQGRGAGRKLDMKNKADRKLQKELIEHEITHANTVAYITKAFEEPNSKENKEVRYFKKTVDQLASMLPKLRADAMQGKSKLSDETLTRIDYIVAQGNEVDQVAEFVAVMDSEPETAADIYKILSKSNPSSSLLKRIQAFIDKVKTAFLEISEADFAKEVDIEKLYSSLANTVAMGEAQREQNYQEAKGYLDAYDRTYGAGPILRDVNYLNQAVASMLNSKLEKNGQRLIGRAHDTMKLVFPIYTDVANKLAGIYEDSSALQQIMHTITGEGIDKVKKANLLSDFAKVMASQTAVVNDQIGKFNKLMEPLSDSEKKTLGRFVTEMPLHDYFVLANGIETEEAIATEVKKLEKSLNKSAKGVLRDVNGLIDWNVKGEPGVKVYNLEAADVSLESDIGKEARKLLALKSIQTIGSKEFVKFLENTDLVNLIKDTSVANRLSLIDNKGTSNLKDSLVPDYYKESFAIEAITRGELKRYENGEVTGWKVLTPPEGNKLGIVYKPIIDSTSIPGAYTDIKLSSNKDITVTGDKAKSKGVVKTKDGHKLLLTKQQKKDLGLVEDFTQALVRGTAHSMAVQESQIIRDGLLREDTRIVLGNSTKELEQIIDSGNVENPWFVKLPEGKSISDMPAAVRAKYMQVKGASNVNKFNEEVDLVRKDISHWLMGGSASSLFQNPQMKWIMRIVKDFVAGSKIGMVVMNPIKIANDNISNVSYLGAMGVSPVFIAKSYKSIAGDFQAYSDLTRQIIQLKVRLVANPNSDSIKKQIKTLRDRVARNPLGDISDKGFINSLGSDLVAKNADTLSGLQADMHTALEYLLTNKEGNRNYVSHFITQLHNIGANGEDFLTYIGNIASRAGKSGKGMQHQLDQVADRLKEIRTEEDVVNYVSQFTNSPGSEAVRLGASMTDLTDVMAKETLYRHLTEVEDLSPEAARIKVLDSFPDYKENMPLAIKQLSDVGIIMFPSFWLRIQKVIYRLGRDKPVNLATELLLEEALGSNVNTIIDANIFNKADSFGGLMHMPLESAGIGSVIPQHIW